MYSLIPLANNWIWFNENKRTCNETMECILQYTCMWAIYTELEEGDDLYILHAILVFLIHDGSAFRLMIVNKNKENE
jgi:hypothetical protein